MVTSIKGTLTNEMVRQTKIDKYKVTMKSKHKKSCKPVTKLLRYSRLNMDLLAFYELVNFLITI